MRLPFGICLTGILTLWGIPTHANSGSKIAQVDDTATCLSINTIAPVYKNRRRNPTQDHVYGLTCDGPIAYFANEWSNLVNYSFIFIDKTMLLKHVLTSPHQAILFAYPQRWGKTINLDMIRHFVEMEVDSRGRKIEPGNNTYYYNLFKYGEAGDELEEIIFQKPLLISKYEDLFRKYQGHYPVIYMDLFNYGVSSFAQYMEGLYYRAFLMYKQHGYMLTVFQEVMNSTTASTDEKFEAGEIYKKFIKYTTVDNLDKEDLLPCVRFLSAVLYKHFNKKLYVFVDEYDDLINWLFFEKDVLERDRILEFHYQFIEYSFRDNPYIEKVIFAGLTGLARQTAGPAMSNVVEYNYTTSPINRFFAYDDQELEAIYDHLQVSKMNRTIIEQWCHQYKKNITGPYKMYNPRFINMYFDTYEFTTYVNYEPFRRTFDQVMPKIKSMPGFRDAWVDILVWSGNLYTIEQDASQTPGTISTPTTSG